MCTHYSSYKETQRLISAFRMRECVYNVKQIFLKLSSHPATFLAEPGAFFFFSRVAMKRASLLVQVWRINDGGMGLLVESQQDRVGGWSHGMVSWVHGC